MSAKPNPSPDKLAAQAETTTVTVPARTAFLIRRAFLPRNPNKLRGATPEVVQAAKDFIANVEGRL